MTEDEIRTRVRKSYARTAVSQASCCGSSEAEDAGISNCVINLVSDKRRVFEEALRILKPQGRLMVSDIVLQRELPEDVKMKAHPASCVQGAIMKDEYLDMVRQAGFQEVRIVKSSQYGPEDLEDDPDLKVTVFNRKKNTEEIKRVSELKEEAKKTVADALAATMSVDVLVIKPSE